MKVLETMTSHPITIGSDENLEKAMQVMDESLVRHLPVVDGKRLVGILSDRNILEATGWLPNRVRDVFDPECRTRKVHDVMSGPAVTTHADTSIVSACLDMLGRSIGCLPVVDEAGHLIGMVTEMDAVSLFVRECGGGANDPSVEHRMTKEPTSISEEGTLEKAAELMISLGVRHLPVLQEGHLIGMISDRDIQRAIGCGRTGQTLVDEIMTKEVRTVTMEDTLSDAADLMSRYRIGAIPVLDDGYLVGLVTVSDVLDACLDELREPEELKNS